MKRICKVKINGIIHDAKLFRTLTAANNFIAKNENKEIIFDCSHHYYVADKKEN